jgi:hypothetical protein
MTALREGLPPLPDQLADAPIDERGFPVPWFVAWIDGKPDFRCMDSRKLVRAVEDRLCWTCGGALGAHKVFAIGPMCAVSRSTAEPPSHLACAEFAVKACPFLTEPKRHRREKDMPATRLEVGEMIKRNPGVTALWTTKKYDVFRVENGIMFTLGPALSVSWWCRGRAATRDEVIASMETGLPTLREMSDNAKDLADLEQAYAEAQRLLPAVSA